jgi:hypothetical protein
MNHRRQAGRPLRSLLLLRSPVEAGWKGEKFREMYLAGFGTASSLGLGSSLACLRTHEQGVGCGGGLLYSRELRGPPCMIHTRSSEIQFCCIYMNRKQILKYIKTQKIATNEFFKIQLFSSSITTLPSDMIELVKLHALANTTKSPN